MAQPSISAAARAEGKARGTLHRYIKAGKLSTSKDASVSPVIETAELLRVFGTLKGSGNKTETVETPIRAVESNSLQHVLETTLELLKQQLKASQEREERLLDLLEREQDARRDLERRLLPPGSNTGNPAYPEGGTTGVMGIQDECDQSFVKNGDESGGQTVGGSSLEKVNAGSPVTIAASATCQPAVATGHAAPVGQAARPGKSKCPQVPGQSGQKRKGFWSWLFES